MDHPSADQSTSPERAFSFRALLIALCDIYALLVVLYLIASLLIGDRLWLIALVHNITPWLLLAGLIPLGLQIVWRQRARIALAAIPPAAFALLYGVFFVPDLRPVPACAAPAGGCQTLTVMTYNLGSGLAHPAALVEAIRSSNADIVALEEFSAAYAEPVQQELSPAYPYQVLYGRDIHGKAILSRYPILEDSGLFQISTSMWHLTALIDVDGVPVRLVVAHPPRPFYARGIGYIREPGTMDDFQTLAAMATQGGPAILLGDFNAVDQTQFYAVLVDAGLRDSFREAGWGLGATYPNIHNSAGGFPSLFRIDYIWHTSDFEAIHAWIGPDAGSDHRSLLAELRWLP